MLEIAPHAITKHNKKQHDQIVAKLKERMPPLQVFTKAVEFMIDDEYKVHEGEYLSYCWEIYVHLFGHVYPEAHRNAFESYFCNRNNFKTITDQEQKSSNDFMSEDN